MYFYIGEKTTPREALTGDDGEEELS